MPTLKQRALDGRAERRLAHPGPAGEPPREPSTPERSAPGPSQRPARAPGTVADIMRPSAATVGEYDHVAAAAYLMKHARSATLVVLGAQRGNRPVGVITEADIAWAVADGMDVNKTRIHDLPTARQPSRSDQHPRRGHNHGEPGVAAGAGHRRHRLDRDRRHRRHLRRAPRAARRMTGPGGLDAAIY